MLGLSTLAAAALRAFAWSILTGRTFTAARAVLTRMLPAVFAVNFLSVAAQAPGLIGPAGLAPLAATLDEAEERLAYRARKKLPTPRATRLMTAATVALWRLFGVERVRSPAVGAAAIAAFVAVLILLLFFYFYQLGSGADRIGVGNPICGRSVLGFIDARF